MNKESPEFEEDHTELIKVSEDKTKMEIDPRLMSEGAISQILTNQVYHCRNVDVRIVYEFDDCTDEITPEQIVQARTVWPAYESQYFIQQKAQELSYANRITIEHLKKED